MSSEPEMIYIEVSRLEDLIKQNQELKKAGDESAKICLQKMLAVYEVLEKDGIINILSGFIGSEANAFSLIAPIGRILPKMKNYGDNEIFAEVFNMEFFETAKKAAK